MKNKLILSLALLIAVSLSFDAEAQYKRRKRSRYGYAKRQNQKKFSKYSGGKVGYSGVGNPNYQTIGFSINTGLYMGDLAPGPERLSADYGGSFVPKGVGVTYSKVMYPGIFFRGGFNWIQLSGTDFQEPSEIDPNDPSSIGRYQRNFHFKNDILELSAGFEADLIPSNSGARGRFPINPYLYVGVAGFFNNPKAKAPEFDQAGNPTGQAGEWVALQPLQTSDESYSRIQLAIPIGLGCKFKVTRDIDVNLEFGLRYTFTDYIDDVGSGGYRHFDDFEDNVLARSLSERGTETEGYVRDGFKMNAQTRDASLYEAVQTGDYTHGREYTVGSPRANSDLNDFYVVTQLRVVYILDKKGMSKGKFR